MINLCAPAIIYLIFSITQILIDSFNGLYNTVVIKTIVTIMITTLLNILCQRGLGFVSWIIVFIPFILMTVIVTVLLYVLGLDAATGTINYKYKDSQRGYNNLVKSDRLGNILIYDPEYDIKKDAVYYKNPNIIVPNPLQNDYRKK